MKCILDQVFLVRDLLALLAGLPVEVKSIVASNVTCVAAESRGVQHPVSIFFPSQPPRIDADTEMQLLFPMVHLDNCLQSAFQSWFQKQEKLRTVIELCLSIIYSRHQLLRFEYLALIQALESYHRIERSKSEQMCLKRRLRKLHDSLPKRLHYIAKDEAYLQSLVDTRHCFSHYNYDDTKCKKSLKDNDLYDAITRLVPFIATMLYRELGIPDEKIIKAFDRVEFYGLWGRPWLKR